MGNVHFGIPGHLVERVRTDTGIEAAVETGTFRGDSTVVLAGLFERVWSCDPEPDCLRIAAATLDRAGCADRVRLVGASSATCLRDVLAEIDEPAVFWLDAHWSPWMPVDDRPQSPLRDELAAIADWPHAGRSVVLVDDASLYRHPPADPRHRCDEWPDWDEVVRSVGEIAGGHVELVDDVLVGLPG